MASHFRTSRRVEFCETDMAGIVHFSNFNKWMEQAEHEFFRSLGLKIVNPQPDGSTIGWPRVTAQCRFESPAYYEDVLEIQLMVQRIGVKSLTYEVVFSCGDRIIARGSLKTVSCRMQHGEPLQSVPIPREYLDQLDEYTGA